VCHQYLFHQPSNTVSVTTSGFIGAARVDEVPVAIGTITSTAIRSTVMDPGEVFTRRRHTSGTVFTIATHVTIDCHHGTVIVHGAVAELCGTQSAQ